MLRDDDDIWDDLVDLHFEDGDGLLAVLRAYLDASTREDSGLLSVAVYLFDSRRVRRFKQAWRNAFSVEAFSWADLIARSGQFRGLRGEQGNQEHTRLVTAGVSIVREHINAGAVSSCWKQDVENFAPTWVKGFGHAYSIAGHMAMAGMGNWARHNNYKGGISYVIEAGDPGHDQLEALLSYASKSEYVGDLYQWKAHTTVSKTPCSPFHAPDLLAWEWGKYLQETVVQNKRLMRLSFGHLIVDRLESYKFLPLYGDPLLRFFNRIRELGVQQLQEDAEASVEPMDVSEAVAALAQTEPVGDPE